MYRVKDDLKRLKNGASIKRAKDWQVWRHLVEATKQKKNFGFPSIEIKGYYFIHLCQDISEKCVN